MRASPERRRLASQVALIKRYHGPDAPQLAVLRCRLDELRVAEIIAWCAASQAELPESAEIANVHRSARRMLGGPGAAA